VNADHLECVLLADRHHGVSESVRGLLAAAFRAVVMVADEHSLLESATRLRPKLAVVDLSLARESSLGWLNRLHATVPELKIIVISVHAEASVCRACMENGATGFVLKRTLSAELLAAVDAVLAGRQYVSAAVANPQAAAAGLNLAPDPITVTTSPAQDLLTTTAKPDANLRML
jgi:DNA-binding NarL/FixJ family response regulator